MAKQQKPVNQPAPTPAPTPAADTPAPAPTPVPEPDNDSPGKTDPAAIPAPAPAAVEDKPDIDPAAVAPGRHVSTFSHDSGGTICVDMRHVSALIIEGSRLTFHTTGGAILTHLFTDSNALQRVVNTWQRAHGF